MDWILQPYRAGSGPATIRGGAMVTLGPALSWAQLLGHENITRSLHRAVSGGHLHWVGIPN
eukprot:5651342-Amphidinium_carterae.1